MSFDPPILDKAVHKALDNPAKLPANSPPDQVADARVGGASRNGSRYGSHPAAQRTGELAKKITSLCANINAATYELLVLLEEFDREGHYQGFLSTAQWLSYHCGIGPGAAREKVRVAKVLVGLPAIAAAFQRGELSYCKVRALTRVAQPSTDTKLLELAQCSSGQQLEKILRRYRQVAARASAGQAQHHAGAELDCYENEAGELVLKARLPADMGALVVQALAQQLHQLASTPDDQSDVHTSAAELRAQALVNMAQQALVNSELPTGARIGDAFCTSGTADGAAPTNSATNAPTNSATNTPSTLFATSSTTSSATSPTATPNSPHGSSAARHYQVHVELNQNGEGGATSALANGSPLSKAVTERLLCDSSLVGHQSAEDGTPLNVGRKTRTIAGVLRRALERRDQGCRFPGCRHSRFVDAHHVQHWANGGHTKLDNLVLLCSRHHRMIHEGGYSVKTEHHPSAAVSFRFFTPEGEHLPAVPEVLQQGSVVALQQDVPAGTSGFGSRLYPQYPQAHPDYAHINWVLLQSLGPTLSQTLE